MNDPNLVVKPAVAFGMSLTVACGDTAQLQIQTHVERDAPEHERQAVLDQLYASGVRVQSRFRIAAVQALIEAKRVTLRQQGEIFAAAEADFVASTAKRQADAAQIEADDQERWEANGRRGEYRPPAGVVERVRTVRHAQTRAEDEREQARRSHEGFVASAMQQIEAWTAEIASLEGALNGPVRE